MCKYCWSMYSGIAFVKWLVNIYVTNLQLFFVKFIKFVDNYNIHVEDSQMLNSDNGNKKLKAILGRGL